MRQKRNFYTNRMKLKIAMEGGAGCKREVARKYNVQPSQIRRWLKNIDKIREAALRKSSSMTTSTGPRIRKKDVEQDVYNWVTSMRDQQIALSTKQVRRLFFHDNMTLTYRRLYSMHFLWTRHFTMDS